MDTTIFIWGMLLFFIIYCSVRLAINPLLNKQDEHIIYDNDFGLIKLRDIGVFSGKELQEVIELYQNQDNVRKNSEQYNKYSKVLRDLKEMEYFDDEQYLIRLSKLNDYFMVK